MTEFRDREIRALCQAVADVVDDKLAALRTEFAAQLEEHHRLWHASETQALAEVDRIVARLTTPVDLEEIG